MIGRTGYFCNQRGLCTLLLSQNRGLKDSILWQSIKLNDNASNFLVTLEWLLKEKLCSSRLTHCPFLHPLSLVTLPTDIYVLDFALDFIPVDTRMPLKFGTEVLSSVTCARVKVRVKNKLGKEAEGWGETPECSMGLAIRN